jgi:hypothetical protein
MELPIFNTYMNFSRHHLCCLTVVHLFVLDKSMTWNRCLQHLCFQKLCKIAEASKNLDSNAQYFLSDLLTHLWFHSMLFALPGYQFPYSVINRCLYLRHHDSLAGTYIAWGLANIFETRYSLLVSKISSTYFMAVYVYTTCVFKCYLF